MGNEIAYALLSQIFQAYLSVFWGGFLVSFGRTVRVILVYIQLPVSISIFKNDCISIT